MHRIIVTLVAFLALTTPFRADAEELAETEVGHDLVYRLGCAGCHTLGDPNFAGFASSGPDLRRIASKTSPGWTYAWILAPRELRPDTTMPHFFDDGDPDEVRAIVAYLEASSEAAEYPPPPAGDPIRGEELFLSVGCTGCHLREAGAERHAVQGGELARRAGPNLVHLGSKVNAAWLFAWLKDPKQYAPDARMPDLRLTDQEAADLTAFLMTSRNPAEESLAFESTDLPADPEAAEEGREAIEIYGCYGCHQIAGFEDAPKHAGDWDSPAGFSEHGFSGLPDFAFSAPEMEAIQAAFGGAEADPAIVTGRRLVTQYGCRGCHLVEGRGQGVRATVDEALLPPSLEHEGAQVRPAWLTAFLREPTLLRPWLTARMPTYRFSDEELGVVVAYFRALEERELAADPPGAPEPGSVALGREAFALLECARCHPAGPADSGQDATASPLDLAPSLVGARERLRYEWVKEWLRDPQSQQPGTRMPTYFPPSPDGMPMSPFAGAFDSPDLAEPRQRLMESFPSDDELETALGDSNRLITALADYIWTLADPPPPR